MKEEKEVWKDIEGYEGLYQVSNMGRVKSLERTIWNNGGLYKKSERILKAYDNGHGYLRVELYKEGNREQPLVHVLVATAFLDNVDNLPEVNHKDEDKTNNCVENLEYCSRLYNNTYNGRAKKIGKKNSKPVFSVNKESGLIMWWESIMEASRQTGISQGNISNCCQGKAKSAGNHIWFYADDDNE